MTAQLRWDTANGAWNSESSNDEQNRDDGFTLVELLVVLVILGLLASLAAPRIFDFGEKARQDTAGLQIANFKTALEMYRLDAADFPSTQQGLAALIEQPQGVGRWNGPYLSELPQDPWGHEYVYKSPGDHGDYDLASLGADNRPGGDGDDADITNW